MIIIREFKFEYFLSTSFNIVNRLMWSPLMLLRFILPELVVSYINDLEIFDIPSTYRQDFIILSSQNP